MISDDQRSPLENRVQVAAMARHIEVIYHGGIFGASTASKKNSFLNIKEDSPSILPEDTGSVTTLKRVAELV